MSARTVVSLFAGAGGSSMGYILAGYKPRLAVEWDKHAAACYALNFPHTPLYIGDVGALTDAEALRLAGLASRELDVLDGSPPCQGFSTPGAMRTTSTGAVLRAVQGGKGKPTIPKKHIPALARWVQYELFDGLDDEPPKRE